MSLRTDMQQLFKCNVPSVQRGDAFEKLEIDASQKTEIERRFLLLQQQLSVGTTGGNFQNKLDTNFIQEVNQRNLVRVGEAVRSAHFNPDRINSFQKFLVRDMGVVHNFIGMGDEFSNGGWVRESMNRIRRLWSGGINKQLRQLGAMKYAQENYPQVYQMLKKQGLRQDQIDRITTELVEKAMYPILRDTQNLAPRGRALLEQKYLSFVDSLYRTYHLNDAQVKQLMQMGEGMGQVYHKIAVAAQEAGINVRETPFWGYFPRIMSTDAQRRFTWKWDDQNHIKWFGESGSTPPTEMLLKSRTTNQYIVEDEVLLDFVIRQLGLQDKQNPRYYYELVSQEPDAGIADVLDSNYGLAQIVGAALENGHPETVEALLDSGVLSRVPYSTVEVFEYLKDTMKFPFENLREVFAVDWGTGMQVYREQLRSIAEQSGFVNLMVKGAVEDGWGVNGAQRLKNPTQFEGWVPLREVISPNILSKSFQSYNPIVGDLYVHPLVAQLAKAQQELVMSPQALGVFGRMVHSLNTRFKQLALATLEYVPRQIWQNLISLAAAGGAIQKLPMNATRFLLYELLHDKAPELALRLFDNKRKAYQLGDGQILTELELVQYMEDTGTLSRFEPLTGGQLRPGKYAPNGIKRQMRYLANTMRVEGLPRTIEEATEFLGGMLDKATYPFAWSNNWLNNSSVFTLIESTTQLRGDTGGLRKLVHAAGTLPSLSLKSFPTVDEAIQHARNYFFYYDDVTYNDRMISNFVLPFWGFTSKNIPATIRYAVRHPTRFYTWQRAYALANSPMHDEEWLNEGSTDQWMLESNPIWFKIPGADGRDDFFALPMEPLDPYNSALNWIKEPAESLMSAMGIWNEHRIMSTQERINEAPWNETGTNAALRQVLENTYPLWKGLAAEVTGEDLIGAPLAEGETIDSFLGLRMSPRLRLWLTTLAPVLRTIDSYNPGNVFGTARTYDVNTGEWSLGQNSWAGVPRTSRDGFGTGNRFAALRFAGLKIYPVDVYLNAGQTYDSLSVSVSEGRKFVAKAKEDAALLPPGATREQRLEEIAEMEYILYETQQDLIKFGDFMRREGLNPYQAYQRLRQRNVRIGDLPDAAEENIQTPEQ